MSTTDKQTANAEPETFSVVNDDGVTPRLCELWWFDGIRGEHNHLVNIDEAGADELIAKLTAWRDAPRLAARKPISACSVIDVDHVHGGALIKSPAGEWGVIDSDGLSHAPAWFEAAGLMQDWYTDEAEASRAYRDETGKVRCESCARFIDHEDAAVDVEGIYTCLDEAACGAACAAKESAK